MLAWQRRRAMLIYFWHILNGQGLIMTSLSKHLPATVEKRCQYSLRNAKSVQFSQCSSSARLSSFIPSAVALWNSLPVPVTSTLSFVAFVKSFDEHFAANQFSFGILS